MNRKPAWMALLVLSVFLLTLLVMPSPAAAQAPATIRVTICLTGSDGSTLVPGTSRYQLGPIAYFGQGTDANGCLYHDFPDTTSNLTVWTSYNNTSSEKLTQDITIDPVFNFQTNKLTLKLNTCAATPLSGGTARMKVGGTTYNFPAPNSTDANGQTSAEIFPGTYDFEMRYNSTTEWKTAQVIPDADHEIAWTTTLVSLNWPGQISYGGTSGDGTWFSKPAMEMMPGTVRFHFRPYGANPGATTDLSFSGCTYNGGYIQLVDEAGSPLANYPADFPAEQRNLKWKNRCGGSWSSWTAFQTDSNGMTPYSITCSNWDKKITMVLNQTSSEQDVTVNSTFQAAKVNVNLQTCNPETPLAGGVVAQGGGFWYTHGSTDASGTRSFYAFPGNNVKVRMNYNYGSNTQNSVPVTFPTTDIDFTTTTVNLLGNNVKIGVSGWPTISMPIELLPGTYKFRIDGTQVNGVVISGCEYSAGLLKVKDEGGVPVAGATFTPACGGGWQSELPGSTGADGTLFAEIPACMTKIKAGVGNSAQELTLAQLNASNFTYVTQILRVYLKDHAGNPITDQTGTLMQGGGTWIGLGNFNASGYVDVQTFPVASAKYRASYNDNTEEKSGIPVIDAAGIQEVDFQTGQVFGSCITQYQGAGWSTFIDGMEQMPGTRTFRYPAQAATVTAGQVTNLTCPAPLSLPGVGPGPADS